MALGLAADDVDVFQPGAAIESKVGQVLAEESKTFAKKKNCDQGKDDNRDRERPSALPQTRGVLRLLLLLLACAAGLWTMYALRGVLLLLLLSMLQFVPDDRAYPAVAELVDALPSGSYLAISHGALETFDREQYDAVGAVYRRSTARGGALRDRAGIARFLAGLEPVEPGLVWVSQWRPGSLADAGPQPERIAMLAAVARKP